MAFHRKCEHLLALKPGIAVIPECANIELIREKAPGSTQALQSGLARTSTRDSVFLPSVILRLSSPQFIRINFHTSCLAVWACHKNKNSYEAGLGPLSRAISHYREFIEEYPTVVAGDFNDNVLWDKPKRLNSFGINISELAALGLQSAYHHSRGVGQGAEAEPTIYWRRKL
jgi:hypothetical protein